ncbi:dihydrodipicolinate synthase family protein [Candidatus Thorarchaeota archaeon]|nr:MAG: dihydrodipicolinate synthase family protein [Candidatus Thorarchaeota archaeon]
MDIQKLRNALSGLSVTTATPFTENLEEIDAKGLEMNLDYLQENGIRFVVPCGNTGEYYSLSEDEWKQVVEVTLSTVGSKMTVMPGIGGSIGTAKRQMDYAEFQGADMAMVMYPQHVFSSEEGFLNYCHDILDSAGNIGIVLYKRGPLLSDGVLSALAGHKRLVGVKYAFGRIVDFARSVQTVGKNIVWSCGTAERFAPFFWLAGAHGFTSGLGNFAPEVSLSMHDSLVEEDLSKAMRIQHMISELEYLREERGAANNVPVIKAGLDHVGLVGGDCRPPIHPLSDAERKRVVEVIQQWDAEH